MLLKFQNSTLYNHLVDKNLCSLIDKRIDLKDYFESHLPIYQINEESYPALHSDTETYIFGVNIEEIGNIVDKYEEYIGKHIDSSDNEEK